MKPIIVDMSDMSDSIEVYESKPNPFLAYVIYILAAILLVTFVWMYCFDIDILVKANGVFKSNEHVVVVCTETSGVLVESNVVEGQYVNEGDILFVLDVEKLEETIGVYKELYSNAQDRIDILQAYNNYLNGDKNAIHTCIDNRYYDEFIYRIELFDVTITNSELDINSQKEQYRKELDDINSQIEMFQKQIDNLKQVEIDVKNRVNTFDSTESYYHSIVSAYISNYNALVHKYDDVYMSVEKEAAIDSLELQQIESLEQQIEAIKVSLSSSNSSKALIETQLELLNNKTLNSSKISMLMEQQSVAIELMDYYTKRDEYENTLEQCELECKNANIVAKSSGYIYLLGNQNIGSYVTAGTTMCQIIPENLSGYYAEVYVENDDIAKLKEGQEVKFEIAAYPSTEYGYLTGVIESISKDIKVEQTTGSGYYLVKIKCDEMMLTDEEGETVSIMSGMACQAKIVVEKKNVLQYLFEKLELFD